MKRILFSVILMFTILAVFTSMTLTDMESSVDVVPEGSTWVLTEITGSNIKQRKGQKAFIRVSPEAGKFSGYSSCNFFNGNLEMKDSLINFKDFSTGKRICDEETIFMESSLLSLLSKATKWKMENGQLFLYENDLKILEFKTGDQTKEQAQKSE